MSPAVRALARALFVTVLTPCAALAAGSPVPQSLPILTISDAQLVEGDAGTKQMVFDVSMSSSSASDVWFDWRTGNGSAQSSTDYASVYNARVTIPAGSTSATLSVTVSGDTLGEGDEYFVVLPFGFNGVDYEGANPVGRILNDDPLPVLSIADAWVSEASNSVRVTVSLPQPALSPVNFEIVAANGTATEGTDFQAPILASGTINPKESAASFWVNIIGDSTAEDDEYFTLSLANVNGATVGDGSAKITIYNDDGVSGPKLSIGNASVTEGDAGEKELKFSLTLSQPAATDVYFDAFTHDDSARAGFDYVSTSATGLKIPAGSTGGYFVVPVIGDTVPEPMEYFYVGLGNIVGAVMGDGEAYGTINDNDSASPNGTLRVGDVKISEGQSGTKTATFTVSLSEPSNAAVSFDIGTANGTAISGEDYVPLLLFEQSLAPGQTSKTFDVTVLGDTVIEPDEYFYLVIYNSSGTDNVQQSAKGTILSDDSDGTPMISVDDASVLEGDSGTRQMVFSVRLAAPADHPISYRLTTSDSSADSDGGTTSPWDYVATSQDQTIPAGGSGSTFSVPITGDTVYEAPESFKVSISNIVGAVGSGNVAYGVIDDDDAPAPTLFINGASINEGDSGTKAMYFTVGLNGVADVPVTFDVFTSDGSAIAGSDYVATNLTGLTIPAGESTKSFSVDIIGDTEVESNEAFTVNVSNVRGVEVSRSSAGAGIRNDDESTPGPWLNIADVAVAEGDSGTSTATFTVELTSAASTDVSFDIATAGGSAESGVDFVAKSLVGQTIAAGQTSTTFTVTINGDDTIETDETYKVAITNVTGAILGDGVATGTITNDDFADNPSLSVGDYFTLEGNNGMGGVLVSVWLSAPTDHDVTFSFATEDGTAVAPGDYTAVATIGTIAATTRSAQFTIPIVGDKEIEPDPETFYVNVTNVSGATVADGQGTIWIGNDDQEPTPSLTINDVNLVEGDSGTKTMTFTVSLSAASSSPVSFDIRTQDVTATAGSDYVAQSLTGQAIAAGETGKTFSVTINGDASNEPDESFEVIVSNVSVGVIVVDDTAIGTIVNDDEAPALSINDVSVAEGDSGPKSLVFTISLSSPQSGPVRVDAATVNGTATAGSDFVAKAVSGLRIPAGSTSKSFAISINGDAAFEPDETFSVRLSNPQGAIISDDEGVATIVNDDTGTLPTISIAGASASEGDSGTKILIFTVSLSSASAGPVGFDIATASGTATAGSDYVAMNFSGQTISAGQTSKSFSITINGDTEVEPDESFTVNLSNVSGASVSGGSAIGTILNDDGGVPSLSVGDLVVAEGDSGTKVMTFVLSLSGTSASDVTVDVATEDGTANAGLDYVAKSVSGLTIPAGFSSGVFDVTVNGDTEVEPNENFFVNLSNATGAAIGDGQAVGTITNDDAAGGPTLSIGDVFITEGDSGTKSASFIVSLSSPQSTAVRFDIATSNGTASAGSDYVAKSVSGMRIPIGATSKAFAVTINGDTIAEPDETFVVNLSNPVGATIADGQAIGTIGNDDAEATPTLSIADASVIEGDAGTKILTFTVSLTPVAAGNVSYDIATSNGTATAGSDYVASSLVGQTIAAGGMSATFAVTVNGDTVSEADETFGVTLSNVSGAALGDGSAVGTITNDDGGGSGPTLSIGDVSVTEGNSLSRRAIFTVTLSAPALANVTYDIATANGTATAGSDFVAKSLTGASILAGATSKTFAVSVKGDTTPESDETFTVKVSNVVGATIADDQATGTIVNDDAGIVSMARFDARGLVDDIDDGNQAPLVSTGEYAMLLHDAARNLCGRTGVATVVGVDGVENGAVLADLADTANSQCSGRPHYQAVMTEGAPIGFLVEAIDAPDGRGVKVLSAPRSNALTWLTELSVLAPGHERPLTILLPAALPRQAAARGAQLKAVAQYLGSVQRAEPDARLVLIGDVTVPGLLDLTARGWAESGRGTEPPPGQRVFVSQPLMTDLGGTRVEFEPSTENDPPAQLLKLRP